MKRYKKIVLFLTVVIFISVNAACQTQKGSVSESNIKVEKKKKKKKRKKTKLPKIDLSHWKVTIPVSNEKGKPFEVGPPKISDYANNEMLKAYMYNDSTRGTLVFYAEPTSSTTKNTKYSRSELREQMVPGDNNTNWTFAQGGNMKGKLSVSDVSRDANGNHHRVIIMQIHGRLTNEQRDLIGEDDNNAPPMLKIYWDKGKVRIKTKVLKNLNATNTEILHEDAWDDDKGFNFEQEVGFRKFTLEVQVSNGKMVIILNNNEYAVYDSIHIKRWNVFENYFKAGNYFQTRDEGASAKVNYYTLEVSH